MPRPKTRTDVDVLAAAYALLHRDGPAALTFASVAAACGLSPATLVQRFGSKAGLVRAALLHGWDRLDRKTADLAAAAERTPAGAIAMLVALSGDYGGIESYADGLLVLREDLRDPVLRARGAAWRDALSRGLEDRFPDGPRGIGLLLASQWQGTLIWWGFDPRGELGPFVEAELARFVAAVAA